jgi:hypothetical protein
MLYQLSYAPIGLKPPHFMAQSATPPFPQRHPKACHLSLGHVVLERFDFAQELGRRTKDDKGDHLNLIM